jgi:hypothetical protein
MLARLREPSVNYEGVLTGKYKNDRLPSPMVVELRVGAQVMFTKNGNKWVNGSIGTVLKTLPDKVHVRLLEDGEVVEVASAVWEQFDYQFNPNRRDRAIYCRNVFADSPCAGLVGDDPQKPGQNPRSSAHRLGCRCV